MAGPGDQFGFWRGAETVEIRLAVRGGQLQHLQPVAAVRHIGEQRRIGRTDDNVLRIVERAVERHALVEFGRQRLGHVEDDQAVALGCDIGKGARDIDPPRIG